MIKVEAISGHGGKTPACFLAELDGKRFLLDLGEGPEAGLFPDVSGLGQIDAVLISHSHKDHIGGLHLLAEIGHPPVYSTALVREISGHPALHASRDLPLRGTTTVLGVSVETGRASHAPGGIWMRLGGEEGILYTGDWTRESPLFDIDPMPRAAIAICDASYGKHDLSLAVGMEALVAEAVKGPLLLPMPPAGRGLDAAIMFSEAGFKIALCPAHRSIAERLIASGRGEISDEGRLRLAAVLEKAASLDAGSAPLGVMIAAPADAADGLAARLAARFVEDGAARIVFTGHVADGSLGKELVTSGKAGFVRWNVHPRASDIRWFADQVRPEAILPAFATRQALEDLATLYPNIRFSGPTVEI
jgi:Cft2 family RNA processing exonuclease